MLSTENISTESKYPKTLQPGNRVAKINDITLERPNFPDAQQKGSYHIILHLEGVDMGADFEGLNLDKERPELGRYAGQIGRVKSSYFHYEDGVTKSGIPVKRDESILKFFAFLAKALGKSAEINAIRAQTIEEYVPLAAKLLSGPQFLNWCLAGKEYYNAQNYLNYDLFLPKSEGGRYPYEMVDQPVSRLLVFNEAIHIKKKAVPQPAPGFEAGGGMLSTGAMGGAPMGAPIDLSGGMGGFPGYNPVGAPAPQFNQQPNFAAPAPQQYAAPQAPAPQQQYATPQQPQYPQGYPDPNAGFNQPQYYQAPAPQAAPAQNYAAPAPAPGQRGIAPNTDFDL